MVYSPGYWAMKCLIILYSDRALSFDSAVLGGGGERGCIYPRLDPNEGPEDGFFSIFLSLCSPVFVTLQYLP